MQRTRLFGLVLLGFAFLAVAWIQSRRDVGPVPTDDGDAARRQQMEEFRSRYENATQSLQRGDWDQAAQWYQQALKLDPEHEDSLYYLGNCYMDQGRYQEALGAYQRLVAANPRGSSRGYLNLGLVFASLQPDGPLDLERAEGFFRQALELDPNSSALLNLAEVALLRGQWDEARQLLKDFNAEHALHPAPAYLLGYLAWREGRSGASAEWYHDAITRMMKARGTISPSEEGDVSEETDWLWRALVRQSVLGEQWQPLLLRATDYEAIREDEYQRLDDELAKLGSEPDF